MIGRRQVRALSAALIAVALLAGCSSTDSHGPADGGTSAEGGTDAEGGAGEPASAGPGPRPLTTEEAERLAVARFRNYDDGVREVSFEVTDAGATYAVDGWVDWTQHLGYGVAAGGSESLLLAWSPAALSSHPWTVGEPAPLPVPGLADGAQDWISSDLLPEASRLHAVLALVLTLGADRPDNALLLSQTDARWLRTDEVAGVPVDVITGPTADVAYDPETSTAAGDGSDATIRYWVGEEGSILRLEARLGGGSEWTVVELGPAADVEFAEAFLGAADG